MYNNKKIINKFNIAYAFCNFRNLCYACHVVSYSLFLEHVTRDPLCIWRSYDNLHRESQQHAVESRNALCRSKDACGIYYTVRLLIVREHLSRMPLCFLVFVQGPSHREPAAYRRNTAGSCVAISTVARCHLQ